MHHCPCHHASPPITTLRTIHTGTIQHSEPSPSYANILMNIMQKILELCSMQSDINSPTQDDYVFCGHAWNEFEFCLAVPLLLCPSNLKCLLSRVFKTHLHKTGGGRLAADWHRFDTCNAILQCTVCGHAAANTGTALERSRMYNV